jgi:hypothetical protein
MKIKFTDVGRNKQTWEAVCKGQLTYDWMYEQVKPYILSSNIQFAENGAIVVGDVHTMGQFQIVEESVQIQCRCCDGVPPLCLTDIKQIVEDGGVAYMMNTEHIKNEVKKLGYAITLQNNEQGHPVLMYIHKP